METKKTIKTKIVFLTKIKQRLLEEEYSNLQHFLQTGKDLGVYSANKQQAQRAYKKIKPNKEYPLPIRKDLLKIERRDTRIAKYWARIPVKGRRGGIWVAIKPHRQIESDMQILESKLLKFKGEFYLYIVVQKEIHTKTDYGNILAVDLGIHNMAVTTNSKTKKSHFYGKKLRAVRGHYFYLRRKLPNRKAIKKVGSHEKRIVNHELHKISKAVVLEARETKSTIILGKLKGIRKNRRGRKGNRKLGSFPFYKVSNYIRYKAEWLGVPVMIINEAYTSQTCSVCGRRGKRRNGLFKCFCGVELNADYNGAKNIMKRGLGLVSKLGAEANPLRTSPTDSLSPMMREEITSLKR